MATTTQDDFAGVRARWWDMLTGGDALDPEMPQVRAILDATAASVSGHLDEMDRSSGRTFLWPDLDFTGSSADKSSDIGGTFGRLRNFAQAYAYPGSTLQGDQAVLEALLDGLDWMYEHKYNEDVSRYGNWWFWEIGAPQSLTTTTLLAFDALGQERRAALMRAVDRWCPAPSMTGANLLWTAEIVATRGALVEDAAKLVAAQEAIPAALEIVTSGDGPYADGSFLQHQRHPYTGGYGASLVKSTSRLIYLLADSPWELATPGVQTLMNWVDEGMVPWLYKGSFLSPVRGRSISRATEGDHLRGANVTHSLMWLARTADDEHAARWRGLVKHTLQADTFGDLYDTTELSTIVQVAEIADDDTIAVVTPPIRNKQYPNMDRVVHTRPAFTFALSMSSSRIYAYESINQENVRGWHTGSGMQYVYNDDQAHYDDGYWATVDHARLPGTTVPVGPRESSAGHNYLSDKHWAGGVAVGTLGVAGMEFRTFAETDQYAAPTGKTSWFMFDDRIAVLGAGINASSGQVVESIAENRRILDAGQSFVVDGADQGPSDWEQVLDGSGWAHLEGTEPSSGIGYVFGDGATVHAKREFRTGTWADVNENPTHAHPEPITHEYLTMWFDHGVDPVDASYAYTLLPGATAAQVERYARAPELEVLVNTPAVQAVRRGPTFGANFWDTEAPAVNGIRCVGSASVLVTQKGPQITVAVSDPTHGAVGVVVDNTVAQLTPAQAWRTSTSLPGFHGSNYAFAEPGEAAPVARWNPGRLSPGQYAVQVWLPDGNLERTPQASYSIHHAGEVTTFSLNHQQTGGSWITVAEDLDFAGDGTEYVELVVNDVSPSGRERTYAIVDAVRFVPATAEVGVVRLSVPKSAGRVVAKDDRIEVVSLKPEISLEIDLVDSAGATVAATFEL